MFDEADVVAVEDELLEPHAASMPPKPNAATAKVADLDFLIRSGRLASLSSTSFPPSLSMPHPQPVKAFVVVASRYWETGSDLSGQAIAYRDLALEFATTLPRATATTSAPP